jgi:DNA processing protein
MTISSDEHVRRVQLALIATPGHPVTGLLVDRLGTAETLRLAQDRDATVPLGLAGAWFDAWRNHLRNPATTSEVTATLAACDLLGIDTLVPSDPLWPTGLNDLDLTEPLVLFARGDARLLTRPLHAKIAVIGSRAATQYGTNVAEQVAADLADSGYTVVSGGAYGIDAAAHRGALAAPAGTIAVLAGGLDRYYPAGNTDLLRQVAQTGAVVSEAPPGTPPSRARLLQRNRIVAATTGATVVVEAAMRSGSLDTVQRAHNLHRTVAAFPGPVTSTASSGTNRLIAARWA